MKLQLIGNIAKLNQTIESFKSNYRVELILKRNRFIRSVLLLTVIVTAVYIFCMVFFQANIEAVVAFAAAIILCFIISIVAIEPKTQTAIRNEAERAVQKMYGDRQLIMDKYHSGYILSAEIVSVGRNSLKLRFDCDGGNDYVTSYYLETYLMRSSDKSCQGILTVDIQESRAVCYYLDNIFVGDILYLSNQFVPKG